MRVVVRGQQILELEGAKVKKHHLYYYRSTGSLGLAVCQPVKFPNLKTLEEARKQAKQSKAKASKR